VDEEDVVAVFVPHGLAGLEQPHGQQHLQAPGGNRPARPPGLLVESAVSRPFVSVHGWLPHLRFDGFGTHPLQRR
jgi:hypothetical protein